MRERSERVKSPATYVLDSFTRLFLLGPAFFRTVLPCSGGCHVERGGMPLHDAIGINCKNGATTENKGAYVDDCVCVI